eukprot:6193248-Pleurochrysis_carterae.AAC.1
MNMRSLLRIGGDLSAFPFSLSADYQAHLSGSSVSNLHRIIKPMPSGVGAAPPRHAAPLCHHVPASCVRMVKHAASFRNISVSPCTQALDAPPRQSPALPPFPLPPAPPH